MKDGHKGGRPRQSRGGCGTKQMNSFGHREVSLLEAEGVCKQYMTVFTTFLLSMIMIALLDFWSKRNQISAHVYVWGRLE